MVICGWYGHFCLAIMALFTTIMTLTAALFTLQIVVSSQTLGCRGTYVWLRTYEVFTQPCDIQWPAPPPPPPLPIPNPHPKFLAATAKEQKQICLLQPG